MENFNILQNLTYRKLVAFWQFSRPHTVIGTSLSIVALFAIAFAKVYPETQLLPSLSTLIWALLACLCGNVYIVGLNQITDIEIDKINKPQLPLASGEFSPKEGQVIVWSMGLIAVAIALSQGIFLAITVVSSLLIGTAYSLPPIRLKRFPLWASVCIFVVRGMIINLCLFLHFQQHFNSLLLPNTLSPYIPNEIWGLTIFVLIFTYVIAIFKDMPDAKGDAKFRIMTLTLTLGKKKVFNLSRRILLSLYVGTALFAILGILTGVNIWAIALSHVGLGILMWWRSMQVDLSDRFSITNFYQFIWKLFYLEYVLFPVACILH